MIKLEKTLSVCTPDPFFLWFGWDSKCLPQKVLNSTLDYKFLLLFLEFIDSFELFRDLIPLPIVIVVLVALCL